MDLTSSLIKKELVKCVKEIPFLLLVLVLEVVLLCCIFNDLPLNSLMKEQVWKRLEPWLLPVKVFDKNHGTSLQMEQN